MSGQHDIASSAPALSTLLIGVCSSPDEHGTVVVQLFWSIKSLAGGISIFNFRTNVAIERFIVPKWYRATKTTLWHLKRLMRKVDG